MLNVTQLLADEVECRLSANFAVSFGGRDSDYLTLAVRAARDALAQIATSDALYHNCEHTAHVGLVGLQILLGKQILHGNVSRENWLNVVVALMCHDIGYAPCACSNDVAERIATGVNNVTVRRTHGCSDAALMPIHVDRGKRYVAESFSSDTATIDISFVQACIERTRFPVPSDPLYREVTDYPGLVRAADLLGQLSDPRYLHKLSAVFYEFEEIGFNATTGYRKPGDLRDAYPNFFEKNVTPYIGPASHFLEQTKEGREILSSLYHNVELAREPFAATLARA
ncbi:MAG: metal-dependent phosphohydrolase [Gammaproteobacteria bacterium]|nr:metal-dependent phosphohydrolase [Gammaproteobacteria bacterium]